MAGGLFGMGGTAGTSNPSNGLLGGDQDQEAMRNYMLKNFLMKTGIGLLSAGPQQGSSYSFGQALGQAAGQGLQGAEDAQQAYMGNVKTASQMKLQQAQEARAQAEAQRAQTQADRAQKEYEQQEAQKAALIAGLGPDADQSLKTVVQMDPMGYAKSVYEGKQQAAKDERAAKMAQNAISIATGGANLAGAPQVSGSGVPMAAGSAVAGAPQVGAPQAPMPQAAPSAPAGVPATPDDINPPPSVLSQALMLEQARPGEGVKHIAEYRMNMWKQAREEYQQGAAFQSQKKLAEATATNDAEAINAAKLAESNVAMFDQNLAKMKQLAQTATSTPIGHGRDWIAHQFGHETSGAQSEAELNQMVSSTLLPMLKQTFPGATSDRESAELFKTLAGDSNMPASTKIKLIENFANQQKALLAAKQSRAANSGANYTPAQNKPQPPAAGKTSTGLSWSLG